MLSSDEALEFLQNYKAKVGHKAIFRGEAALYPETLPSIYRHDEVTKKALTQVIPNLALHIFDTKLRFHLEDFYGLTLYKGEPFGANDLISPSSDMDGRHTFRGLVGLMQHYGIPTEWVDFTSSPSVSIAFAARSNKSTTGYVYYGQFMDLSNEGIIIDLCRFAKDLRSILPLPESRPERQHALAFRPYEVQCVRQKLERLEFIKDSSNLYCYSDLFPGDALRTWFMGQVVDYYMDYIERKRRLNVEFQGIDPDEDESGLTSSLEHLITEWNLWM
jgi:hypothetical protein